MIRFFYHRLFMLMCTYSLESRCFLSKNLVCSPQCQPGSWMTCMPTRMVKSSQQISCHLGRLNIQKKWQERLHLTPVDLHPTHREGCFGRLAFSLIQDIRLSSSIDGLKAKLLDPDDKVHAATCQVFFQRDYEVALHHLSENLLHTVADRFLDKKGSILLLSLSSATHLFRPLFVSRPFTVLTNSISFA